MPEQPERFYSVLCLYCLGHPEHIKEHPDYGEPWIPTPEELEDLDSNLCDRPSEYP
jgi:hypothetical protein